MDDHNRLMSDDELDSFFDSLDKKPVSAPKTHIFVSSDEEEEKLEEKAKAFVLPPDPEEQNSEDLAMNEPQYVLAPDHSKITYPPFQRNIFFNQLTDHLNSVTEEERVNFQDTNDVTVSNSSIKPISSFKPFVYQQSLLATYLTMNNIVEPTAVQRQAIPIAFSGQDLIVVSPTGTGKTLCFLIPLIFHIQAQKKNDKSIYTPISLILSPTELLAHQTFEVFVQLTRDTNLKAVEITSGSNKYKQSNFLLKGADVIIATPGRLISFLTNIDWKTCTFVVIDEADKIMETGFFRQLRSILDYIRPDRQTLLFGATLPAQIEELFQNTLYLSARVQIGRVGAPQKRIEHNFIDFENTQGKLEWLIKNLNSFDDGLVLIFVSNKKFCETLANEIKIVTQSVGFVHGELPQSLREETFKKFKTGEFRFLVVTDIAARGIDINDIRTVINYDIPDTPQNYIHRVGRTARGKNSGVSYTLLTSRDFKYANEILGHFLRSGIDPPEDLISFIEKNGEASANDSKKKAVFDYDFNS